MRNDSQIMAPDGFARFLCSDELGGDLGRVGYKFVRDMLVGMQRTRSVNLTDIAKSLNEDIRLHATHKRLSRNLDNPPRCGFGRPAFATWSTEGGEQNAVNCPPA